MAGSALLIYGTVADPDAIDLHLRGDHRPLLPDDSCCCQWCAPTLNVGAIDRVAPFQ